MNQVWFQVMAVLIGGSVVKYLYYHPFFWVGVDLAVFGISYLILRRYPMLDLRRSMTFLGGLTLINVLVDLGIVSGMIGNIGLLALLGWMMLGGGNGGARRRRY